MVELPQADDGPPELVPDDDDGPQALLHLPPPDVGPEGCLLLPDSDDGWERNGTTSLFVRFVVRGNPFHTKTTRNHMVLLFGRLQQNHKIDPRGACVWRQSWVCDDFQRKSSGTKLGL